MFILKFANKIVNVYQNVSHIGDKENEMQLLVVWCYKKICKWLYENFKNNTTSLVLMVVENNFCKWIT